MLIKRLNKRFNVFFYFFFVDLFNHIKTKDLYITSKLSLLFNNKKVGFWRGYKMKKTIMLCVLIAIMALLTTSAVFAYNMDSTRRVNSNYQFERDYSYRTSERINPISSNFLGVSTRRILLPVFDNEELTPLGVYLKDAAVLDSFAGDGSIISTKRINSKYAMNRVYGSSRSFGEL